MKKTEIIKIIDTIYTENDLGQRVPTKTNRDIYANITSISGSEFFAGYRDGRRPALRAIVNIYDYLNCSNYKDMRVADGAQSFIYQEKEYTIYRTFVDGDSIELYAEIKGGLDV